MISTSELFAYLDAGPLEIYALIFCVAGLCLWLEHRTAGGFHE